MRLSTLRSALYAAARILGDANALAKGKLIQRLMRSRIHAKTGSLINRWFR
jgi:hypothetical protein